MRIKFVCTPTIIEVECKLVPRIDELVNISIQNITIEGRVKDVCWLVKDGMSRGPEVKIILEQCD